jgi:hypothetical protein
MHADPEQLKVLEELTKIIFPMTARMYSVYTVECKRKVGAGQRVIVDYVQLTFLRAWVLWRCWFCTSHT